MLNFIIWCIIIAVAVGIGMFFVNLILVAVIYVIVGIGSLIGYVFNQFKEFFTREETN